MVDLARAWVRTMAGQTPEQFELALEKLEFDEIRIRLQAQCLFSVSREQAVALEPSTDRWLVDRWLEYRAPLAVVGGSFVVDETTGPREGVKGDGTLSGRIAIQVQDASGVTTLQGYFSVPATTWG